MPSFDKHLEQARHNKSLVLNMKENVTMPFQDWLVTILFYECVHLVEAMIFSSKSGFNVPSDEKRYPETRNYVKQMAKHSIDLSGAYKRAGHELRQALIKDNQKFFGNVGTACSIIRKLSQSARYDCQSITDDDVKDVESLIFNAEKFFNSWAINYNLGTI